MHDRSEWTENTSGEPVKIDKKTYTNLVEFSRLCTTCKAPFSIFVTRKIAGGMADSNSFGLKNCPEHRNGKAAADETLAMANAVMREELAGLYARDQEHMAEIQVLKARLSKYELQGAVEKISQKMPWEA